MNQANQNNLDKKILKKARYVLLPGKISPSSPYFTLYKNVYSLWSNTWKKAFSDVGSPEAYTADDFYRQDIIPVIAMGNEPLAAHFYTFFHTENPAAMDHHYFEIFPEQAIQYLKDNGAQKLMSMEYLTVNYSYRRSIVGFSLAEVLVSLGSRLMFDFNIDASLGVALKVARIDKMGFKMNYEIITEEARRGNLVCSIMAGFKHTKNLGVLPEKDVREFVDQLWRKKEIGLEILSEERKVA